MSNKLTAAVVALSMFGWVSTSNVDGRGGGGGGGGRGGGGGGGRGGAHVSAGGAHFAGARTVGVSRTATGFNSVRAVHNVNGVHHVNGFHHANNFHHVNNFHHFHNGFNRGFFGRPFWGLGWGWPWGWGGGWGWPYGGGSGYPYYDNYYGDYGDYGYSYPYSSAYYPPVSNMNGYSNGAGPYSNGFPMPVNPYGPGPYAMPLPADDNATYPYNGNPKGVAPVEKPPQPEPKEQSSPEGQFIKTVALPGHSFAAYGEQPVAKIAPAAKITPVTSTTVRSTAVAPARSVYPAYGEQVPELPLLTESNR